MSKINNVRLPNATTAYEATQFNQLIRSLEQVIFQLNTTYASGANEDKTDALIWFSSGQLGGIGAGYGGLSIIEVTANYTATPEDSTILCDATGGDIVITLPSATGLLAHVFNIKKIDATDNIVTITPTSPDTIDGEASVSTVEQWTNIALQSNGTNWFIL